MARTNKTADDFYDIIQRAAQTAAPLFNLYGWSYFMSENSRPTFNELEETITDLVNDVIKYYNKSDENRVSVGTGRFVVSYQEYDEEKELSICLELASQSEFKVWQ